MSSIILILLLMGCNSKAETNRKFVMYYEKENFDEFKNSSFLIRSGDNSGGIIIFAYDYGLYTDTVNNPNVHPYIITIDRRSLQIKRTSCHLMNSDSTEINKEKLEKLSQRFLKYNINSLKVDSNKNVIISLRYDERPNLIRFSNLKFKSSRYDSWEHVKDNWYQKVE